MNVAERASAPRVDRGDFDDLCGLCGRPLNPYTDYITGEVDWCCYDDSHPGVCWMVRP